MISKNHLLHHFLVGKRNVKNHVREYDSYHLKQVFDIKTLDLAKVAKSFGFIVPPVVDFSKFFNLIIEVISCTIETHSKLEQKCKSFLEQIY